MKIPKKRLAEIIREELALHVKALNEAGADVQDAHQDTKDKEDKGQKDKQKSQDDPDYGGSPKSNSPQTPKPDDGPNPNEQPEGEDPNDQELEKNTDAEDTDEKEADAKKKLGDQLTGKSIQSVTQEPKSKVLPGAQEIVVTFDNSTDPLRILVTKTGQVKFYYAGALHNEV